MNSNALFDDLLYRYRIIEGKLSYGDYSDARTGIFTHDERQNFLSRILNLLLTHDFLYIRIQSLEEFTILLGARNTLKLLQDGILKIIDDGGAMSIFLPNEGQNMLMNVTSDAFTPDRILKRLIDKFKGNLESKSLASIGYITDRDKINLDGPWLLKLADDENIQDMQNDGLLRLLGFSNRYDNIVVKEDDIVPLMRLNQINKGFIYQNELEIKTLSTESSARGVIDYKIGNYLATARNDAILTFEEILKDKQIPDFTSLLIQGTMSFDDFLKIRNDFEGKLFREWLESIDYNRDETRKILMSSVKTKNPYTFNSLLRWGITNLIGIMNIPAGLVASAVDNFIVGKYIKGEWHPNLFLDDRLTKNIEKIQSAYSKEMDLQRKNRFFKSIPSPNDMCCCLSGLKFKECCGKSIN